MKAVVFERPGIPEDVLQIRDIAIPDCGPRDILVRVRARVIQPADRLFIAGAYSTKPTYPQVAGFDGAGVIEAIGRNVEEVSVGDRVAFHSPGAWAEFVAVPVDRVYLVPKEHSDRLSDELACQLPLNPLTAWGLLDLIPRHKDQRILLTAARSSVAAMACLLAQRRSMIVERLVRGDAGYELLGATNESKRLGQSVAEALASSQPYDVIFDPVGGPDTLALIDRTAIGATLISYGVLDDRPIEIKASTLLYKALSWKGFAVSVWQREAGRESLAAAVKECWQMLAEHPDALPVLARHGLADFAEAIAHAERQAGAGKVVLI